MRSTCQLTKWCPDADEESEEDGDYDLTDKFIAADEDEEGEGQVLIAMTPYV